MIYIKVKLDNTYGLINYQGLDLSEIVGGSQLYPFTVGINDNTFYSIYLGSIEGLDGVEEVTEQEYLDVKQSIDNIPKPKSTDQRIEQLEQQLAQTNAEKELMFETMNEILTVVIPSLMMEK